MHIVTLAPILLRFWWLGLILGALGIGGTYFWYSQTAARFESSVTLQLNPAAQSGLLPYSAESGRVRGDVTMLAASYAELLRSRSFGQLVVDYLKLNSDPQLVAEAISARLVTNTNILRVTVTADTPEQAQVLAEGIATVFIVENLRRQQDVPGVQSRLEEIEATAATHREHIETLRAQRDELYDRLQAGDTDSLTDANALDSRLSALEASYASLLVEINRTRESLNTASILDHATTGRMVWPPPLYQPLLVGLFVGLVIAMGLAMLIDQLDDRLHRPEDLVAISGSGPLAVVGRIGTRNWALGTQASHLATRYAERSAGAESFRTLRTNLRFASDTALRCLLITSASPAEGKTLVATNLAVVFAQAGKRVLLVDADLRRPSVHSTFGIRNEIGLVDALEHALDDSDDDTEPASPADDPRIVQSDVPNLALLPSGKIPTNPDVMLGSDSLGRLKERLLREWDLVIFDSPPLGPVADALLVSAHVDATLVVARHGRTRRGALRAALEALRQAGRPALGVVLNDLHLAPLTSLVSGGGGYYYGYSHRYYGAERMSGAGGERANGHVAEPVAPSPPSADVTSDAPR